MVENVSRVEHDGPRGPEKHVNFEGRHGSKRRKSGVADSCTTVLVCPFGERVVTGDVDVDILTLQSIFPVTRKISLHRGDLPAWSASNDAMSVT